MRKDDEIGIAQLLENTGPWHDLGEGKYRKVVAMLGMAGAVAGYSRWVKA